MQLFGCRKHRCGFFQQDNRVHICVISPRADPARPGRMLFDLPVLVSRAAPLCVATVMKS